MLTDLRWRGNVNVMTVTGLADLQRARQLVNTFKHWAGRGNRNYHWVTYYVEYAWTFAELAWGATNPVAYDRPLAERTASLAALAEKTAEWRAEQGRPDALVAVWRDAARLLDTLPTSDRHGPAGPDGQT